MNSRFLMCASIIILLVSGCRNGQETDRRLNSMDSRLNTISGRMDDILATLATTVSVLEQTQETESSAAFEVKKLKQRNEELTEEISLLKKKVAELTAGKLTPQYAARQLITLLGHSNSDVSSSAVKILSILADPETIDPLIAITQSRADPAIRKNAVSALSAFKGNKKVEQTLISLITSTEKDIRKAVYEACGAIGSEPLLDPLINALKKELAQPKRSGYSYNQTVGNAAQALGRFSQIKAGKALLPLLGSTNTNIRRLAAQALRNYSNAEIIPDVMEFLAKTKDPQPDEYSPPQAALLYMLRRLEDPRGCEPAIKLLGSRNDNIRRAAADLLEHLADARYAPKLIEMLTSGKAGKNRLLDNDTRASVAEALGRTADPRAAGILIRCTKSKHRHLAYSAAQALRTCVDPKLTEDLIKAWKGCTESSVKRYLKQVLSSGAYPVIWNADDKTFVPDKERLFKLQKRDPPEEEKKEGEKEIF